MSTDIINTIILAASFLALFGSAEILYHKFKLKGEVTRKIVHVGTGLLTLLFPVMLSGHWWVLLLCVSFAVILIASLLFNFLPSINNINRRSVGSLAYPVSVYTAFLFYDHYNKDKVFFYLPILVLAISDPIAALVGKKYPYKSFSIGSTRKTLSGSLACFVSAFIISFIIIYTNNAAAPLVAVIFKSLLIALAVAIAEAVSGKGYDNITIPVAVLACLVLIQKNP